MSLTAMSTPELKVHDDSTLKRKLADDFGLTSLSHMRVFLRVRPILSSDSDTKECLSIESSQSVLLVAPEQSATFRNHSANEARTKQRFTFTRVFGPSEEQRTFFNGAVLNTVSEFVNGLNCLVFAYGTTNSGKTYTVQGSAADPGVIPQALDVIFKSIGSKLDTNLNMQPLNTCFVEKLSSLSVNELSSSKSLLLEGVEEFYASLSSSQASEQSTDLFDYTTKDGEIAELSINEYQNFRFQLWASFAEIYNENIYDLLEICPDKRKKLRLTIDRTGSNYIKGLKIIPIDTPREARQLLSLGRRNLHIASTKLNQSSSRSHCIFTVYLVRVVESPDPQQAMLNSLSFCDLAGSERVFKTQNTGVRLKEAGKINNSLMVFGRCIEVLKTAPNAKERPLVPFRDSKLTQLFQLFFCGKGRASMIVNVSPTSDMFDDTVNVLKVSAFAKQVVSDDQLDKSCLNMTSASQRLTDWIKTGQRWSSFSKGKNIRNVSILTVKEEDVLLEKEEGHQEQVLEEEPDVQELIDLYQDLEKKYNDLVDEHVNLEMKLRTELCQEFQEQLVDLGKHYESRIAKVKESDEAYMEKRLEIAEKALLLNAKFRDDSDNDGMDEDGCSSEELDALQNELSHVKSEKESLVLQIKELELTIEGLEKKAKTFEIQSLHKQEELLSNLKDVCEKESKIMALTQEIQKRDLEVNELQIKLSDIAAKETELFDVREELSRKLKEMECLSEDLATVKASSARDKCHYENELADLDSKHIRKVASLEQEIQELSSKISEAEIYITDEKTSFENRLATLQADYKNKIKSLEEEMNNLIKKVSQNTEAASRIQKDQENNLTDVNSDLQKRVTMLQNELSKSEKVFLDEKNRADKLQSSLKEAEENCNRAVKDLEKMGDILFDKDVEIDNLTKKLTSVGQEKSCCQNIKLNLKRHHEDSQNEKQELTEIIKKKDADLSLLQAQIATLERINSTDDFDFKPPATRTRRRRKCANENAAPKEDLSQCSTSSAQEDDSLLRTSSISSSPEEKSKESLRPPLAIIDYIKQSSPVTAARNAFGSLRESVRTKCAPNEDATTVCTGSVRKLRRKMYEKDIYMPLECTPPKQSNNTTPVHAIVARQLRNRK